ncbi:lipid storage droplets surface-binding protein 1-like isoform 2-T2 [Menidia menidia]
MPKNNNLKVPSAVARLAQLPVVRSACATLLELYNDAKSSSCNLKSMCEAMEGRATALSSTVAPVILKFEPQISIANEVACKSLDWLETSFPVILSPTDQVVATAKNKMQEIQDVVSITAKGTMGCVQYTVTWAMSRILPADGADQSLVERVVSVAGVSLDSVLSLSEAFMDQTKPTRSRVLRVRLTRDNTPSASFPSLLICLRGPTTWLAAGPRLSRCATSSVSPALTQQVLETVSRSTSLVQCSWMSLVCSLQGLPQYFQYQAVSAFFFVAQMYNVSSLPSKQIQNKKRPSNVAQAYLDQVQPQTPAFRLRPTRTFALDNGCNVKGCVRR